MQLFREHHNNLQPLLLHKYNDYCYICEWFDALPCIPFFLQSITRTSHVPSSTSICLCLIFSRKFLTAPTSLTMWSGQPSFKTDYSEFHMALWIILAVTGISVCSPLFKTPLWTALLDGFLLSMKGLSSMNRSPSPLFFFWLGVMNNAAKPNCILPIGDNCSLNGGSSSSELIVIKIKMESEYNSNLQIGMELSIKKKNYGI